MSQFLTAFDAAPAAQRDGLIWAAIAADPAAFFDELQRDRPILAGTTVTVVTRHPDCVEVLNRPAAFSVRPYHMKMAAVGLPVMLGEDDTAIYQRDHGAMQTVARRADLAVLAARMGVAARAELQPGRGAIDLAPIVRRLVAESLAGYFGLDPVRPADLETWCREIFRGVFLAAKVTTEFAAATAAFAAHVTARIAARRRGGAPQDTVLDRLLTLRCGSDQVLDDAAITTNLVGMTAAGLETITDCVACILDALFDHPDGLTAARSAAVIPDTGPLLAVCYEGLRLRPPLELLVRYCEHASPVAEGTDRATLIPAGHIVVAAISAAMRDPAVAPVPRAFRADRRAGIDLTFGSGLHSCFGRRIAEVLIVETVRAALASPHLARLDAMRMDPVSNAFVDAFRIRI